MNTEDNKQIMARNIKRYMDKKGVTNQQVCDALGFKYTTFLDWIKGVTYPRIGKVEAMAQYFGCEKSDLIEDKAKKPALPKQDERGSEIMFALSKGGQKEITDEMFDEVKRFAEYIANRQK